MAAGETPLTGGNVADALVRVGDTVRKPWTTSTAAVHAFLRHLTDRGFAGAPRALGRDDAGRQVLEFVIDWDATAPGTRLGDLAYLVQSFAPLSSGGAPRVDAGRVAAIVDGYRLPADRLSGTTPTSQYPRTHYG